MIPARARAVCWIKNNGTQHREGRRHRRRPDGRRHRPCRGAGGVDGVRSTTSPRIASTRRSRPSTATCRARWPRGRSTKTERKAILERIQLAPTLDKLGRLRPRHRGRVRERRGQAQDLHRASRRSEAGRDPRLQHLLDLDHPARLGDRQPGTLHRHPFHEPGAAHAAGRDRSAASPPRTTPSRPPRTSSPGSARRRRCRRISPPSSSTASCCR